MERLTVFDGEFWGHKNFPPVAEDTVDEFIDCVKELAERLAAIENILGEDYDLERLRELVMADREKRCVIFRKGYGIVSEYEMDEEGFITRTATGVVTREEYDRVLIGGNNEKVLKPRGFAPAD